MSTSTFTARTSDVARDHLRRAREHLARGTVDQAQQRVEDALALARENGDHLLVGDCLAEWGLIDLRGGRLPEAETRLRAAEALTGGGDAWNPRAASALAEVLALTGKAREGRSRLLAMLERMNRDVDAEERAVTLCRLCRVAARQGDLTEAMAAITDAQTLHVLGMAHTLRVTRELATSAKVIEEVRAWRETQAQA